MSLWNCNPGAYSECYIRVTNTGTVNSDATVVCGVAGNPNEFVLEWRRTNTAYYDTLKDSGSIVITVNEQHALRGLRRGPADRFLHRQQRARNHAGEQRLRQRHRASDRGQHQGSLEFPQNFMTNALQTFKSTILVVFSHYLQIKPANRWYYWCSASKCGNSSKGADLLVTGDNGVRMYGVFGTLLMTAAAAAIILAVKSRKAFKSKQ